MSFINSVDTCRQFYTALASYVAADPAIHAFLSAESLGDVTPEAWQSITHGVGTTLPSCTERIARYILLELTKALVLFTKVAVDRFVHAVAEIAKENPFWFTIIALSVLQGATWILKALGLAELGPIEDIFASMHWQGQVHVPGAAHEPNWEPLSAFFESLR